MQSELKSLSKIFSEVILRIPDYQRGYAWEEKQLKDFWSDIEQLPVGKSHYTGVLTLEPVAPEKYVKWDDDKWIIESKRYSPLYVVDGQQRLTTAIILLHSIIDRIKDNDQLNFTDKKEIVKKYIAESKDQGISRSFIFGYEKDNPSYEFLKVGIFGELSDNHSVHEETSYTKNLHAAKLFFMNKLKDFDINKLESVYTKITQFLMFNIFYIDNDLDVFVTFETMNNRGKLLSHLELLKNRLIYLSTKFNGDGSEKDYLRKSINEAWKTIYHNLGKIRLKSYNDDLFLKTHFISFYGSVIKSGEEDKRYNVYRYIGGEERFKEHLLENVFTPKRLNSHDVPLDINEIYRFVSDIKSFVQIFYGVSSPESYDWPADVRHVLCQIQRISNYDIFVLSVAVIKVSKGHSLIKALRLFEKLGFFSKIRSYSFHEMNCYDLAIDIFDRTKGVEEVVSEINKYTERFIGSSDLSDSLRGIGKQSGYYGWSSIRYFMFEYEQHLKEKSKTARNILKWVYDEDEFFLKDYKTVEHIYPQKANDPYWRKMFHAYTVPERNKIKNSLGNLLPVSHAKNSSLGNKSFQDKKGNENEQVGYRYGCLSEIQVSNLPDWGAKEVLARGLMLLEFMEYRWSLTLGSDSEKIKLLGLDFILEREQLDIKQLRSLFSFN